VIHLDKTNTKVPRSHIRLPYQTLIRHTPSLFHQRVLAILAGRDLPPYSTNAPNVGIEVAEVGFLLSSPQSFRTVLGLLQITSKQGVLQNPKPIYTFYKTFANSKTLNPWVHSLRQTHLTNLNSPGKSMPSASSGWARARSSLFQREERTRSMLQLGHLPSKQDTKLGMRRIRQDVCTLDTH
jgi:hypothetical protein